MFDEDIEAVRKVLSEPWASAKRFRAAEEAFERIAARLTPPAANPPPMESDRG